MKQSISHPRHTLPARRGLPLALIAILSLGAAAPAWAGDVCRHADGDGSGGSSAILTSNSFACGYNNEAAGENSLAIGSGNKANGKNSVAMGVDSTAVFADNTVAVGIRTHATGYGATAFGHGSNASDQDATALGSGSRASAKGATAVGGGGSIGASAEGSYSTALGAAAQAGGAGSTAIGLSADAESENNVALGAYSRADGENSVALGAYSRADRSNSVSVGSADQNIKRQIIHVAAGTEATDAVNLSQLQGVAAEAKTYTDTQVASARTTATAAATANAKAYTDTRETAVRSDMAAADATTLQEAKAYSDNTATQTLTAANAYTDNRITELVGMADDFGAFQQRIDDRFAGVDQQLRAQDRRIDKQGAMSSAMLNMANSGNGLAGNNRIGVGVGSQGGETALAVGYQRVVNQRFGISLGGAFSGDDKSVGGGASLSW